MRDIMQGVFKRRSVMTAERKFIGQVSLLEVIFTKTMMR